MEDRYLFRGKRIDNGEWVQGFLSVHTFIPSEEEFEKSGKETYLAPVIESVPERIYDHDVYEVDPSTICQCTGLKDKNGKLIWENDILSGHIDDLFPEEETRKRVMWYEHGWHTNQDGFDDYEKLDDFDSENFEVIGNVVDNLKLLEVQE